MAGATEPSVYNFQNLQLNGTAQVEVVGPIVVTVANGVSLNGSAGAPQHPEWLTLSIAAGGLTLNGNVTFDGAVVAPHGSVTINGNSTLNGSAACDQLIINGRGVLNQAGAP